MVSTRQRSFSNDDAFPTLQLFILAVCRVAEPIALTSIFPYSWVMVREFQVGRPDDASFYSGILVAAFSLAEALTGMHWGSLSDRIGRKPVLLLGCAGTMLSLLVVGFAPNYWVALIGRIIGGVLNGNIGVIQTMVGELVKRPEHEPRAYAVMPFVWSVGTIIGPAIGGILAKPAEGFPSYFSKDGLFGKFPFLLPNLVCSGFLTMSIIAGAILLEETHPMLREKKYMRIGDNRDNGAAETPLMATAGAVANAGADLRAESYGTFNQVEMQREETWHVFADGSKESSSLPQNKAFTYRVIMLVIALGIFTYHSMTFDHLLPIFLQDKHLADQPAPRHGWLHIPGGLGLSIKAVGMVMSVDGLIALFIQSVVFPPLAQWLGVWKLFVLVTTLHPIAYFIVPFLVFLPSKLLFPGIYTCLVVRNVLSIIAYPVLLILIKQASPSTTVLGKINGLAASAGAACRTVAPPAAGYLYSLGSQIGCTAIAWWASSVVAFLGVMQLWWMHQKRDRQVTINAATSCLDAAMGNHPGGQIPEARVHVIVHDPESAPQH